ncbi:ABC transporter substrate-binding protein [Microbacterium sp.]|uniref:ABC transporter substrate-binding protein n=1 Tax=Microbacterium sp. TaxID=51671 RepID=UPI0028A0D653|nr:ABC transporter substrate-binding protein [Microbacterium sp.]
MTLPTRHPRRLAAGALIAAVAVALAACSTGGTTATEVDLSDVSAAQPGGTLDIVAVGDFAALDPLNAYAVDDWGLLRATQRQLVTYPGSAESIAADTELVPDLAESWEISDDRLTYTFTLKDGISYRGATDRAITAEDFVYQVKRFPDPNKQVAAINYFNSAIVGFAEFADGFQQIAPGDLAAAKEYQDTHDIAGVKALDDKTLQFTLTQPAYDFLGILSMGFVSPQPEEIVSQYVGDSLEYRQNIASSGAYAVTEYVPNQKVVLEKDPDYDEESDPRHNFVDRIVVDTTADSAATALQRIQTGDADLALNVDIPPISTIQQYVSQKSPYLFSSASGSLSSIGFNFRPPQSPGQEAIQDLRVRQAIAYAVNKENLIQNRGGEATGTPSGQIITSTLLGYEKFDPYATEGSRGDAAKAKELLTEAGYPDGITLNVAYRSNEDSEKEATTLQEDLAAAGITLNLLPVPPADFHAFLQDEARTSQWDLIANLVYAPDWQGDSTRMILGGWLNSDVSPCGAGNVYGICYDNPELNALADEAFGSEDPGPIWAEADRLVSEDLAWVPVYERNRIVIVSDDVTYFQWSNLATGADPTGLAVAQ